MQLADERGASALQSILNAEQQTQMQGALAHIAAVYREVLLLRFQEELQLEEIAAVLGTPISTVKSRLYRGLAALRQQMEPELS
jgi:RNA polymerase sigma-70 factor (ECF subfamily)